MEGPIDAINCSISLHRLHSRESASTCDRSATNSSLCAFKKDPFLLPVKISYYPLSQYTFDTNYGSEAIEDYANSVIEPSSLPVAQYVARHS